MMKYQVVLEHTEDGVSVRVPGLPGCWSQGADETEALDNIKMAIREYLEVVAQSTQGADVREIDLAV